MSFWTDVRTERLKKLWADGCTASEIAADLGAESRNAVLGKVTRLKLAGRNGNTARSAAAKRGAGSKLKPARLPSAVGPTMRKTPAFRSGRLPPEPSIPEESNPVTILDLTFDHCRWPLWSGSPTIDSLYCGNKKMEGCSYCGRHSKMAWAPARPREKKAEAA